MVNFGNNKQNADKGNGRPTFLADVRRQHDELFASFVANHEEYDSVEDYTDALESQSWEMVEAIAKLSYRNGIARGRERGGRRYGNR